MGMVGKTLKALGTGLDMAHASRMQRADDLGFDTSKTYYHGTASDVGSFDPSRLGSATDASSARQGVWLTDSPDTARSYADHSAKSVPVSRALKDADIAEAAGDWDAYDDALVRAESLEQAIYNEPRRGQNIMPLTSSGRYAEFDAGGQDFMDIQGEIDRTIREAKSGGLSGVNFRNLADDVGFSGRASDHRVVFDPSNIRSVNAAFDPAQKSSANLMAGVGGAAILGGSMLPQDAAASTGQPQGGAMQDIGNVALEVISGINQGVIDVADIPADILNAVFEIMDSETRVPRLGDQPLIQQGTQGGYMEPGVGRQVARTLGEFGSPI